MNMSYSRRDFGKLALAAAPFAQAYGAIHSKFKSVQIGAISYSFRSMQPDEIIPAMVKVGLGQVELMSNDCEALAGAPLPPRGGRGRGVVPAATPAPGDAPGAAGGRRGGRGQMTPEQQEAQRAQQENLKKWRMSASPATFKTVKKQFNDAGIDLHILCFNQRMNATDDEIEYAFQMAKALDVKAISSSSTVAFAKRVAPFADKHKMLWAGHGHDNVADPEEFSTPKSFETILSYSKYIAINLDIGHFTAAGFDPIPYIQQVHSYITNLHLKDRTKPVAGGGRPGNLPWGQGQTPIKEVLQLMSKEKYNFPANIELEYQVPAESDVPTEMSKCLQYCKDALA
jgi:sugar phosphate isomerase/epimerase